VFAEGLHRTLLKDAAKPIAGSSNVQRDPNEPKEQILTCVMAITKLFEHVAALIDQQTKV
jgi:hypothetical protein